MTANTRKYQDGSLVVEVESDDGQLIARLAVRLVDNSPAFDTYKVEAATRMDRKADGDVTLAVGNTTAYAPRKVVLL